MSKSSQKNSQKAKQQSKQILNDKEIIKESEEYFHSYVLYPAKATLWFALLVFIGGFIVGIVNFQMISMLLIWIIGFILCIPLYNTLNILLSPKILEIYYLKEIKEKLEKTEN